MSTKYYRVLKDNFLWHAGAILEMTDSERGYSPVDGNAIWDYTEHNGKEWIYPQIIENCPEYFQRVYPINLLKSTIYKAKEEARLALQEAYK